MSLAPRKLTQGQHEMLVSVLERRVPSVAAAVREDYSLRMPIGELRLIIEVLAAEFSAAGLEANGEPNSYGLALETLIDQLNRCVWAIQGEIG